MDQSEINSAPNHEPNQNIISDYYEGYQKLELQSAENQLKKTKNAIFAIAALLVIGNLITMAASDTFTVTAFVISLAIAAIFVGLAFLTSKKPLTVILISLALFIALWILDVAVIGLQQIYRGILVRGIIIYFLITGIKHAREAERIRKQMNIS
jgi:flagellar biosynthesis protein FliP